MADKTIGTLPKLEDIYDDSLLVVEHQGIAYRLTGAQWKAYAVSAAQSIAKGEPGEDGFSPTVSVSDITGGHRLTVTDKDGKDTFDVLDGADGKPGTPGVGISDIQRTSGTGAPGSTDTYTITLTDGNTAAFQVYNGKNGADGDGSGDMLVATYDPQRKQTDIFQYVDDKIGDIEAILDSINGEII